MSQDRPHDRITTHPEYARAYEHYLSHGSTPADAARLAYEHTRQLTGGSPMRPRPFGRNTTAVVLAVVLGMVALCGVGAVIAAVAGHDTAPAVGETPANATVEPTSDQPSPPPAALAMVPNVVGKRLIQGEAELSTAGFINVTASDATGQGRLPLDPQNWIVRSQTPPAGTRTALDTPVTVKVSKPTDGKGTQNPTVGVVPNVVCKDLQAAQDALQAAGFFNLASVDGTGQGRVQILDRNWVVVRQSAAAGSRPSSTTRIVFAAVKFGEPTGSSGCRS